MESLYRQVSLLRIERKPPRIFAWPKSLLSHLADHSASQLLNKAFQNMTKLADRYVNMRANMTYISPDALQNDGLNQRLIACGRRSDQWQQTGNLLMTVRAIKCGGS